jgi:ribonuclease R
MTINPKGEVIDHIIAETVIKVDTRMSYTSVKKILEDKDAEEIRKYEKLVPMFEQMRDLASILRKKRMKRGSIDFDFPESKIILDRDGCPTEIKPYERNSATRLIEDFMLMANETVAEDYFWQELPFLYRTHETPDREKC